ncbi:tail sheath protein [Tumebacillus sp. BK434]|uniref:phage tail sheath subtilisin-like domain-containing protein n=1 Tax=Tumebacillus sp. BK434 TaxID=2512169 RepID=UPI0010482FCE|nr:phage tail sheath subtilisin-like domain-containing protein [Tumebacillus sp. BK434]TCP57975.1 tail sheath protein [Tumebacillus sp. BK434]
MAGGKWTILDTLDPSQRSGFYINFVADAAAGVQAGVQGVVAIPVTAPWGPEGQLVKITSDLEFAAAFSRLEEGSAKNLVLQALKGGASTVLAYRMAVGAKAATATLKAGATDAVKATAVYTGAYGNELTVSVTDAVAGAKEFKIFDGAKVLEKFSFDGTATGLIAAVNGQSHYVELTKLADGTFTTAVNEPLTGGASGQAVTNAEYSDALAVLEGHAYEFNILTIGSGEGDLQETAAEFIRRLRGEGHFVQLVLGHSANGDFDGAKAAALGLNHEGIVYHNIGVKLGGKTLTPAEFSGRIAGMIAGAGPDASITYALIGGIDGLANLLNHNQIREANKAGLVAAFYDGETYRIEKGINTLTSYSGTQHEGYSKIKNISVLDAIGNALTISANKNYIGKVLNDEVGRDALLGAIRAAFDIFEQGRLIQKGSLVGLDPTRPSVGDQVFLDLRVTPIDAMEEIYTTIRVGR